jgi:hypothetical protein
LMFTSYPNSKYFLFHTSHQIFRHIHGQTDMPLLLAACLRTSIIAIK